MAAASEMMQKVDACCRKTPLSATPALLVERQEPGSERGLPTEAKNE